MVARGWWKAWIAAAAATVIAGLAPGASAPQVSA